MPLATATETPWDSNPDIGQGHRVLSPGHLYLAMVSVLVSTCILLEDLLGSLEALYSTGILYRYNVNF